jgi:hypothetical protein
VPGNLRVFVEGGLYHVYNRFARGESVFSDPEEAIEFVESSPGGEAARRVDGLRVDAGLQSLPHGIANIVDVSPPTVSRWKNGTGTPPLQTQTVIANLRFVVECLADYYTPEETRLWLHTPHPMLGRARAVDLIFSGRTEEVLAVIDQLEAGVHL